ncbi:MAG: nuclear transport factor 2 family protein [Thermoanaerobaculaceae bacterium]|nr:nuclear transport factor 2 family protein [Thermoanaerobaculaceae bacterium]MDI9621973.1 nuclear transport factor 2 family protein [Acidobacteriota bacterium]NLH12808.1 nuclear transport factor 2 family protein [Holophagae bacterium]HPW55613.1 nuclear transport factor 2 family protein [Thermoanaerobaculaceae bacterium]
MTVMLLVALLLAPAQPEPTPAEPVAAPIAPGEGEAATAFFPENAVVRALEELRKGELMLDASALEEMVAASLTVIEEGMRVSGSFAYVEPLRRMRERGSVVKELLFQQPFVRIYGGSAIATYRYLKTWVDEGVKSQEQGWCTDVFERRTDGAWILVMRHRASDRPSRVRR